MVMSIYTIDELKDKIKAIDLKIEKAQSQVSFNGRSVSYQLSELTKQRDYYQGLLDRELAKIKPKKHRVRLAKLGGRF